jgi:hypothetical protein
MEVNRNTFRTILFNEIRIREKLEKEVLYFTQDSSYIATLRKMLAETEHEESTIRLVD